MDASGSRAVWGGTRRWLGAHLRLLGVLLALLLLYTLAGFLLVPHLARNALIDYGQRDLHRHLTIGAVRFNPFTLTAQIRQFALAEADDAPIASFALLRVRADALGSLLHRAWTLSEVRLEQPDVHVLIRHDGSLNLAQLAPPRGAAAPRPAPGALPAVRIGVFSLLGGQLHFEDRSREQPFTTTLTPIEFSLSDFRTQPAFDNRYHFSAATRAGERFEWSGEFSLQPVDSNGRFSIAALRAATIASYLGDALPFELRDGSLDLQGEYHFMPAAGGGLSLRLPSLQIHALAIAPRPLAAEASGGTPWIEVPELEVSDAALALTERKLSVARVSLHNPSLQVRREADGSLNLQRLLGAPGGQAGAGAAAASAAPAWNIDVARFEVDGASVAAEDRSVAPAFKLSVAPLALAVQDFASEGGKPLTFTLQTGLGAKGHLTTSGSLTLATPDATVDAELRNFDLPALQPYVAQVTDMTIERGQLSAKGHLQYAAKPARGQPRLKLTGDIEVANLATRDNVMKAKFITWDMLRVDGLRYQQAPDALEIEEVRARGAYGRVIIAAGGTLNVTDILRPQRVRGASAAVPGAPAAAAAPAAATSVKSAHAARKRVPAAAKAEPPAMPIRIRRIDIENGAANFTDHTVQPSFSSAILGLNGSVIGLSSDPASRAQVALAGSVDRYAPVSISGQVNLLSAATYTDLKMDFRNIELTTFNPYSGKFAGYSIRQGKLTTEMSYHIEDRKLDAQHHIVIDQLEFGAATDSKEAVPLPIKLAVALLKDRNGVIDLELPVTGSLDDPKFRLGPIIWQVLKNLIVKAVTAPFALLGSLFGGGPDLSYVDFPAGSALLGAADTTKLKELAAALVERPQLKLDIPLRVSSPGDDTVLARSALERAIAAAQGGPAPKKTAPGATAPGEAAPGEAAQGAPTAPVALTPAQTAARLKALLAVYRQQFGADPTYPQPGGEGAAAAAAAAGGGEHAPKAVLDDAARIAYLEQQLLPKFAPTPARREALARARAQAAEGAVLANPQVQPERVFLTERASPGSSDTVARMELKLQ